MTTFSILISETKGIKAIPQGFSMLAFIFTAAWAIDNDLIVVFLWTVLAGFVIKSVLFAINPWFGFAGAILVFIVYGMEGNKWALSRAIKKGYEFQMTIEAANRKKAITEYKQGVQGDQT